QSIDRRQADALTLANLVRHPGHHQGRLPRAGVIALLERLSRERAPALASGAHGAPAGPRPVRLFDRLLQAFEVLGLEVDVDQRHGPAALRGGAADVAQQRDRGLGWDAEGAREVRTEVRDGEVDR